MYLNIVTSSPIIKSRDFNGQWSRPKRRHFQSLSLISTQYNITTILVSRPLTEKMLCSTCEQVPLDYFLGNKDYSLPGIRPEYYDHQLSIEAVAASAQNGCELCKLVKSSLHQSSARRTYENDSWSTASHLDGESLASLEDDQVIRIRATRTGSGRAALKLATMKNGIVWRGTILFDTLGVSELSCSWCPKTEQMQAS